MPEIVLPETPEHCLTLKHLINAGFEQEYFLQTDVHYDASDYLRGLHVEHLQEAKRRNAFILDNGDGVDVINSYGDRRGSKSSIRPEHNADDYLDRVIDDVCEFYYKQGVIDSIVLFGQGNHDAKLTKIHNTHILRRIVQKLNEGRSKDIPPIHLAGYGWWVKFSFEHSGGGRQQCVTLHGYHGTGGGGKVTKGVIQTQRMAAMIDADIVVTGHIHEKYTMPHLKVMLNPSTGKVEVREHLHIQLGSYKRDHRPDGQPTWHVMDQGNVPKPVGGGFLKFFWRPGAQIGYKYEPTYVDYRNL